MNTTITESTERLERFDIAKGIAIFLVVIGHLLEQTFEVGHGLQRIIVFCHMPVFFFISGFFLNYSVNKYSKIRVIKNKAQQLIIPFICWSSISLVANIMLIYGHGVLQENIRGQFFEIFICARSVWFLIVLFISQSVFCGLLYMNEYLHCNKYIVLFLGWILISSTIPNTYFSMYKFKWLFPFLIIGAMYAENQKKVQTIIHNLKIISLIFPILCLMVSNDKYYNMYLEFKYSSILSIVVGIAYYLVSLLGIVFIFLISSLLERCKLGQIFINLGIHSLEIYVMHMFFIKFVIIIPLDIVKTNIFYVSICVILYAIIIIALIIFLSKYIFKNLKIYTFIMGKVKKRILK